MIPRADLTDLAARGFQACGVRPHDAQAAATSLVLAEMMGIGTHGVRRIMSYAKRLRSGGIDPQAIITCDRVAPGLVRLDGGNGLGPTIAMRALTEAQDTVRETGIAAVFCRNSNHIGALSPFLWLAAEAGFASILTTTTTPMIAPTGGREALVGNNPLGFGFPDPKGDHILLDIAMSVSSRSRIADAAAAGVPIPEHWANDAQGNPTTDAAAALKGLLQPIGGHKGYGLSLCMDMLAGLWSGAAFLNGIASLSDHPDTAQNLGQTLILIDTARLLPADQAEDRMAQMNAAVHDIPESDPETPVRIPGERAITSLRQCQASGIPVPPAVLSDLQALAKAQA